MGPAKSRQTYDWRTREAERKEQQRFTEQRVPNHRLSILDYLNGDCWRTILEYVPVRAIIRSERVSRKWQEVVLDYLSHVQISVVDKHFRCVDGNRIISISREKPNSFCRFTNKLGNSIVTCHCSSGDTLWIAGENCPNIEDLMLIRIPEPPALCPWMSGAEAVFCHNFQRLKQLSFYLCRTMSDACLGKLLVSNDLQELKFLGNDEMTGQCLINLKSTKLESLVMKSCIKLQSSPLLNIVDRLTGLTKLVLKHVPTKVCNNAYLLVTKMAKLEHLHVDNYRGGHFENVDLFFEAVCRQSGLKFLNVSFPAKAEHVEAVFRSCGDLHTLYLEQTRIMEARTLGVVRRLASERLTELGLNVYTGEDHDDLLELVRACPKLTRLSIPGLTLSPEELERLSNVRRDPAFASAPLLNIHLDNSPDDCMCNGGFYYCADVISKSFVNYDINEYDNVDSDDEFN